MTEMERLPPDQRAVLSLVLTQRKSYAEVSSLLGISEQTVRERAHTALDALGGGDGQILEDESRRGDSRGDGPILPSDEQPDAGAATDSPIATSPVGGGSRPARSSKLGGMLLLGAIAVGIAVAAILLSGSGGKGSGQAATHTSSAASTGGSAASSSSGGTTSPTGGGTGKEGVHIDKRLTLTPTEQSSKASGQGFVLSQGGQRAFYVAAQGLPPSSGFFYAVWLYNSQSSSFPLGRAPNVGSNGRLEGGGPLSAPNPGSFHRIAITRETNPHPSAPGPIVLSGSFALR